MLIFLVLNISKLSAMYFEMKDIASGDSILFAPRLPAEYAVWLGKIKPLSHFKVIII